MQQQRRITWTQPPEPDALDALFELEELEAQSNPSRAARDEIERLRGQLGTVEVEEWRITLHTLSVIDKSRYFALVRTVEPWLDEMYPSTDGETNPERSTLTITAYRAALVLASIGSMERRRRGVLDGDSRDGWEACSIPAEWATVAGYLGSTPTALHDALAMASDALNPQVMLRGTTEQAKKFGGVSGS